MEVERVRFLFGVDELPFAADDQDAAIEFFATDLRDRARDDDNDDVDHNDDVDDEEDGDGTRPLKWRALMRTIVADQILRDEPPDAWATVVRLRSLGLERDAILNQMTMALTREVQRTLAEADESGDATEAGGPRTGTGEYFRSLLASLPVPSGSELIDAIEAVVAGEQGLPLGRVAEGVLARLDRAGDELARLVVDGVIERGFDAGALILLSQDRVVHPKTLAEGIVLTHWLNDAEVELGSLMCVGNDLGGFAWHDGLSWSGALHPEAPDHDAPDPDVAVEVASIEVGHAAWDGPEGWLAGFIEGDLLAVRVERGGAVHIERLDTEPAADPALVTRVRAVYHADVVDTGLPVLCTDLVFALLLADRTTFDHPRPPFTELCELAGLELRGGFVAHDDAPWRAQARLERDQRVHERFDDEETAHQVLDALDTAENPDATNTALRRTLATLDDPDVCWGVLDELVDPDTRNWGELDPDEVAAAEAAVARLLDAASTPTERMLARFVAGVVAERLGDAPAADAHFQLALEVDSAWGELIDRAAWYASLRGDARQAANLWRTLDRPDPVELRTVEECARFARAKVGRNEPCWCGSGRKLKVCHREGIRPVPLADRVGWLCSKAAGYLTRHDGSATRHLIRLAAARAVDPSDRASVAESFQDPLVIDVALTELGWFARFLRDCSALLPDDEAMLLASWPLVDRTVYEIEAVRPGDGLVVRDLRSAERIDVRERTMSEQIAVGHMVCARAVPDGTTHQFVGAVLRVPPGRAAEMLELCDHGDAYELCRYVASMERPPVLQTREGEPLVACTLVLRVPDPEAARRALDAHYEADVDGWVEMHALSEDERILRAQLTLDGDTLTVSTHSEARADRVLAYLRRAVDGVEVLSDERVPLRPGALPTLSAPFPGAIGADVDLDLTAAEADEAREEVVDILERRWIREPVPALGGVTPLEAADDPTRRDDLVRLVASFPETTAGDPRFVTMRPSRLRELLGLDDTTG